MAVGGFVNEKGGHIAGFRKELANCEGDAFFTFFNGGRDEFEACLRGEWDFSYHIAAPIVGHIERPESKICLEIGYGGGRILTAAARHFEHAHGIDVHDKADRVLGALRASGINNVTLHTSDGCCFPIDSMSVDFVFSFIVFQHMELIDIARANINEAFRVLKPGGIALIYFGRLSMLSLRKSSAFLSWLDDIVEHLPWTRPYREMKAHVNETNLRISRRFASTLFRSAGFEIMGWGRSRTKVPDRGRIFGGQTYLLVRKPNLPNT